MTGPGLPLGQTHAGKRRRQSSPFHSKWVAEIQPMVGVSQCWEQVGALGGIPWGSSAPFLLGERGLDPDNPPRVVGVIAGSGWMLCRMGLENQNPCYSLSSRHAAWEPDSPSLPWNIAADWRHAGCWDVISVGFSPVIACVFSLRFLWNS